MLTVAMLPLTLRMYLQLVYPFDHHARSARYCASFHSRLYSLSLKRTSSLSLCTKDAGRGEWRGGRPPYDLREIHEDLFVQCNLVLQTTRCLLRVSP